jgi:hypothetical protein
MPFVSESNALPLSLNQLQGLFERVIQEYTGDVIVDKKKIETLAKKHFSSLFY